MKRSLNQRLRAGAALVAVASCGLAGCGGGEAGRSPAQPSPVVVSVAIVPVTDILKVRATADLSLQATYSDGTTAPVTAATWSSSNTVVAQVANGRVTAMGAGEATITAESPSGRATTSIRVVPDYQGTWSGTYLLKSCTSTGDIAREHVCEELDTPATALMALRLNQNRVDVSGTLTLGTLSGDVRGTIAMSGHIVLNGEVRYQESGMTVTIALRDWQTIATEARMTGSFTQSWTVTGASGSMEIPCELQEVTQTSQTLLPPAGHVAPSGRSPLERALALLRRR